MKELHKRSRNPKYKKKYKVTNWKEYEQSLCNRGSLTLWISPSVIKSWKPHTTKIRGRKQRFSDQAIETILSLRLIFHLPLQQTEGFVNSIFQLMKVKLNKHVLHHTTDAQIIIHPRSNTVVSDKGKWIHREKYVQKILDDGVHKWRRESGYYQQSKVQNTFLLNRYKAILEKKLRVRMEKSREVVVKTKLS